MSDSRNAKVRKKKSRCVEASDSDSSFERPARRKKPRQVLSDDDSSSHDNQPLLVRLRTRSIKTSRVVSDAESSSSSQDCAAGMMVEIITSTDESSSESDGSDESDESYEGEQSTSGSSVWQSDWLSHSEDEDWAVRVTTPARNRVTQGAGSRRGVESRIATRTMAAARAPTTAARTPSTAACAPATASRVPSSDSEDSDGQSEKCPICLRSFTTQEIGTPEACDHSFCSECLQEWAKNVNTCPVDRQMFTLILVRKKLSGKVVRQIPVEERQLQVDIEEPEDDPTYCEICGRNDREDRLLLCDGCDLGYHLECLDPPLNEVPIEQWFCPDCIAAGNTSLGEENLGEEIMHLWEEHDEFEIQRQRRSQLEPRLMPRTRQNVRVSGRVRTRQLQRQAEQPSTSSGLDSQDVESAVRRRSTRPTPAHGRRGKVAKKKRRKKRTTVARKKIKKIKKVKIVNSDGEEEEVEVPCVSKPHKRRKRRKKKSRKVVVRRRARTARVVVPLSTRNRIAEHLRMMAPQRPGQTIPDVRPQRTASTPALGSLGFQRNRAGIPTLHLFGQRDQLDYFSGSDQEEGGGVCVVSRPRRTSALRLLSKKVASISPVTPCDLVSSILDSQSVWHSKKAEVTIKRDGTLQVKNKSEEKSGGNEARDKMEQTGSGRVDVKDPSHSQKVTSRAPMYSGRNSGSGDSRPPPESASRYSGSSFHNYQGGRGFVSVTGFDARSSRAGYSSFLSSPQTLPPPPMMTFRGGPVRFRMSPPRFPPVRSLRPPPLPPRLLHQQIAPTMMEAFDVDDEVRSREEDEEIDLYSDIEVGASCPADDEAEKSYEALPPPPIPPAMLMDFGEQPLSDDDERGSDAELVIDDNGPAQPEIPDSDIYDPASPSRDTDDEAETEKVEPVDIPLPPTRRLVQYSPDSSPPYEIGTYPALTEKLAMAATAVGLQSARNSSDEEEESAECPNFSIYSAASMDLARATDDLDKVHQEQGEEAHPSELADDTGDSEDDAVTNELAKESENSDIASPRSDDGKLLMELEDLPDETTDAKMLLKEAGNTDLIGNSSSDDSQDKAFTTEASSGKRSPSEDSHGKVLHSDESEDEVLPSTNFQKKVMLTDDSQGKAMIMDDSQDKVVPAENTQYRVMPSEDSQEVFVPSEDSQDKVAPSEDSQDKVVPNEDSQDKVVLSEDSQDNVMQSDDSQNKALPVDNSEDKVTWSEDSQDKVMQNDDSQVKENMPVVDSQTKEVVPGEDSQDNGVSFEESQENVASVEDLHNIVIPADDLQEKSMPTEGSQDKSMPTKDSQEKILRSDDLQETALPSEGFQDIVEKSENSQGNMQVCEEELQDKLLRSECVKDAGLDYLAIGSRKYDPEEDTKDDLTDEENNSYSELLVRKVVGAQKMESKSVCEDSEVIVSSTQILEGSVTSPLGSVEEENFGEGDEMDKELGNVEKEKCFDVCDDTFKDGGSPGSTCGDKDVDEDKLDDSAEKGLVSEIIVLGENESEGLVGGVTRAASALTLENIPPPGLEGLETETISETEEAINFDDTISTEEVVYHEDGELSSHKKRKKKKNRKTAEFFNERQASRKELAPIDYEEGEIVDDVQKKDKKSSEKKEKHDVHKVSSDDFDIAVSKLVLEEEKKKRKKKPAVEKKGPSKESLIVTSNENKDKSKDKPTSKDDDENISWKKPSKSTKDRNYRDTKGKEQSPKGKDLLKKDIENKEKKRKKEKRKDMERYDVRKIVGDKKRKKRDEFGRDLPSRDRSYSRSHSRGRSYERLRNRSRSVSRGRGRSPIRTRTIWSMSRSRSRSRNRSRNRSGSRLRNKAKQRSRRSRSREKQRGRQSRDRSKSRGKHSRSKSRSRSINRLRPRSRSRTPARPREKKARSREQNVSARRQRTARDRRSWSHTWTPSWSRSRSRSYSSSYSSYSHSRTPSVRHVNRSYSRSFSRSWSRERHERIPIMNKRVDTITKSAKKLTVIVPNTKDDSERQRKKDKKRKEKKVKESVIEKRKKRKEKSPAPSKEVFTSGDNILVSVNFSKTNKTAGNKSLMASGVGVSVLPTATGKESTKRKHDGTFEGEIIKRKKDRLPKDKNAKVAILAGDKPMSEKKRKKMTKPSPRIAAVMNKKPVAIIDLDQSPFHEQTPSPTDLIVLSDSDEHLDKEQPTASPSPGEKDRAPTPPISDPQTPDSRSPMMNYLVTSTGPKTPPEPQIKFSVATSKTQLRALSNPLREEEMMDEEVVMDQHLDEELDGVMHKGPNTPPEPRGPSTPRSPPISPDAYDPFDPTKSGTPSPVGMEISMDDEEPSPEGTLSEVPQQPSIIAVSSPPLLGDPEELPGKTTDVGPLLAASQDVVEEVILSPPAPPVVVPKSPPLLGEPIPATPVEPEPQPVQDEEPAVVVSEDSVSPQPQKLVVTPVKTQQQPQPQGQLFAAPKPGPQATSTPSVLPLPGFPSLTPSSIISLLTTPPVGRQPFSLLSQPARHNGEAKPEEEVDPDMDSPYSPASSEGDDLFDPPPETSRPAMRAASKSLSKLPLPALPRKSQDKFDSLFGVSPLRGAKAAGRSGRMAKSFPSKSSKSKLKSSGKKEIAIKMDEDQLQILDELPSSAVEMQVKDKFLKKLNRQERVVEEVKLSLKPHYTKKHITKEEYKDILRRSVPKICHNKTGEINPVKIATLVEAYVKKYRYHKKKGGGGGGGGVGSAAKTKLSKTTMWS